MTPEERAFMVTQLCQRDQCWAYARDSMMADLRRIGRGEIQWPQDRDMVVYLAKLAVLELVVQTAEANNPVRFEDDS